MIAVNRYISFDTCYLLLFLLTLILRALDEMWKRTIYHLQ